MPFFQGEQEAEMQKEVLKEPTYEHYSEAILEKKNCSKKSPIIMRATLRMQWSR